MNIVQGRQGRTFAQIALAAAVIVIRPQETVPTAAAGDPLGFAEVRDILGPNAADRRPVRTAGVSA